MPTNDFLPIGQSASTILTQSAWNALSQRTEGWAAGILPPEHYNKSLRQSSTIAAMIGEFIKTIGGLDALDDGNNATLLANFISSLDVRIGGGSVDVSTYRVVTSGPVTAPPSSPIGNDEVLVGDSPSGAFVGNARKLARWNGTSWAFTTVRPGRVFRVNNTDTYWTLDAATGWQTYVVPIAFVSGLSTALSLKFDKTGGTVSGPLFANGSLRASSATILSSPTPGSGSGAGAQITNNDTTYGLLIGIASSGAAWLQPQRLDSGAGAYDLKLNPIGGNVGIGTDPSDKLDVAGGIRGTNLSIQFEGVEKFGLLSGGALSLQGDVGTSSKVLTGGTSASYQALGDLQPQLQYDARWSAATNSATMFSATGAWVTLPLNTLVINAISGASASAGAINLPAGTYRARYWGAASPPNGTGFKFRLRNTTTGQTIGLSAGGGAGGYYAQYGAVGECEFTLSAAQSVELQGFSTGATTVSNLSSTDGEPLVGASITLTKVK